MTPLGADPAVAPSGFALPCCAGEEDEIVALPALVTPLLDWATGADAVTGRLLKGSLLDFATPACAPPLKGSEEVAAVAGPVRFTAPAGAVLAVVEEGARSCTDAGPEAAATGGEGGVTGLAEPSCWAIAIALPVTAVAQSPQIQVRFIPRPLAKKVVDRLSRSGTTFSKGLIR